MSSFIKKSKQKLIIMLITFSMLITIIPDALLAAEGDTNPPEITINVGPGRVKAGTELSFTITDESPIGKIFYQWDQNIDPNSKDMEFEIEEAVKSYTFKIAIPSNLIGLHEFSIAARDGRGNVTNWKSIPYYVVSENVPSGYVDNTAPQFTWNIPQDYPAEDSTIPQGKKFKVGISDENGIYKLGYKWVRELEEGEENAYAKGATIIYKPQGNEFEFTAPQETGIWYLQYYMYDGSNNSKAIWSCFNVADQVAPVI